MPQQSLNTRAYISRLYDCYGNALSERGRSVLELYYGDDLSLSEISELLTITRQGVRDAIKRAETELLSLEAAIGYAEKSALAVKAAKSIRELCDDENICRLADEIIGGL